MNFTEGYWDVKSRNLTALKKMDLESEKCVLRGGDYYEEMPFLSHVSDGFHKTRIGQILELESENDLVISQK